MVKEIIGAAIGVAVAALLVWNIALTGSMSGYVEKVDTTSDWDLAIDEDNSNSYNVTNGTLVMGNNSNVQTVQASIGDTSNATFKAEVKSGSVTATIYNENDTQLFSGSGSGNDTISYDFSSSGDKYYVEFVNQQTADSEVSSYEVRGDSGEIFSLMKAMIVALLGIGVMLMFN